jgi:hypothetical protein
MALVTAQFATAADFEQPPPDDPAAILGERAVGANFRVVSAQSDGLLRVYDIETSYGPLRVEGDEVLQMRLRELAAITALDGLEGTRQYADGLKAAAAQPLEFVGDAIADPVHAVKGTVSGASRLFKRAAAGVRNAGKGRDNVAASLLGVAAARRELAVELGVDTYKDYKPLADRLERAARATALGGLTVKGVLVLIPGAAGVAVSSVSAASSVSDLVKTRTPSELRDINRTRLQDAGVDSRTIDLFLDNRAYTPTDQTIFAAAISDLGGVGHVEVFVARAAGAGSRDLAIFQRRRAELLAHYNAKLSPLREFMLVAGIPLTTTQDGRIVGVFPFDSVAWTDMSGGLVEAVAAELGTDAAAELAITGYATPLTRAQLHRLGWSLTEGLRL